jgi:hypothetical protein
MIYWIHGILILGILFYSGRNVSEKWIYASAALLKIAAGLLLGWIYHFHYGNGDSLRYFNYAQSLLTQADFLQSLTEPVPFFEGQPRAVIFTRIVSVIMYITKGDYWVVSAYFSLISFGAYWFFYRQMMSTLPNLKWPVIIGFLWFPSCVFWSSGIMKGSLTNAAVVVLAALCIKAFYRKKIWIWDVILAITALMTLYFVKYYLLAVLIPVILYALFDRAAFKMGLTRQLRAIVYVFILLLSALTGPFINPNLRLADMPEAIHRNQQRFQEPRVYEKALDVYITPHWHSLLTVLPRATFNGLFGPALWHKGPALSWVPRLENTLLLLLAIWSCIDIFKRRLLKPDILVVACLLYVMILATCLALAVPNFGALSRYKAAFLPFWVCCLSVLPVWSIKESFKFNQF